MRTHFINKVDMFYRIEFIEALNEETFLVEMRKINTDLLEAGFSGWNSDLEYIELAKDNIIEYKYKPIKATEGSVSFNKNWDSKNVALRTYRKIIIQVSDKVTEVYINGGEHITDPDAWFKIPHME